MALETEFWFPNAAKVLEPTTDG